MTPTRPWPRVSTMRLKSRCVSFRGHRLSPRPAPARTPHPLLSFAVLPASESYTYLHSFPPYRSDIDYTPRLLTSKAGHDLRLSIADLSLSLPVRGSIRDRPSGPARGRRCRGMSQLQSDDQGDFRRGRSAGGGGAGGVGSWARARRRGVKDSR